MQLSGGLLEICVSGTQTDKIQDTLHIVKTVKILLVLMHGTTLLMV